MVEAEGDLGGRSEERWALGAGGSAGVLRAIGEPRKLHLFGRDVYHVLGDSHDDLELSLQAQFACGTNGSLSAGVTWRKVYSARDTEATLAWNLFFRQPPSRSLP